jgi:hypothetical protein
VNVQLVLAGSLAIVAAGVHGAGGEILVVRKLSLRTLAPSPFGGPAMTKAMLHVTWHIATIAFLVLGCAMVISGSALHGDTARGIGLFGAGAFTGFALLAVGLGAAYMRSPRAFFRHLGPLALVAVAVLAWWGAL